MQVKRSNVISSLIDNGGGGGGVSSSPSVSFISSTLSFPFPPLLPFPADFPGSLFVFPLEIGF